MSFDRKVQASFEIFVREVNCTMVFLMLAGNNALVVNCNDVDRSSKVRLSPDRMDSIATTSCLKHSFLA